MKKNIYSTWHVKLVLVLIIIAALFMVAKSFYEGYREGDVKRNIEIKVVVASEICDE